MGTSIWEQSLGTGTRNNAATFALTVFPGAWNEQAQTPGVQSFKTAMAANGFKTDDWAVLGYDFVQAAAALNIQSGWSVSGLNSKLSAGPSISWAGAPITWDSSGRASRRLFLFRPSASGRIPADISALRSRHEAEAADSVPSRTSQPASSSLDQLVDSITKN